MWFFVSIFLLIKGIKGELVSPCPDVLTYETNVNEPDTLYGVVKLNNDYTLHGVWLNIVFDYKPHVFNIWIGNATTTDYLEYKIESPDLEIDPATPLKFFVKYNILRRPPKVICIRLNGQEICNADNPTPTAVEYPKEDEVIENRPVPLAVPASHSSTSQNRIIDRDLELDLVPDPLIPPRRRIPNDSNIPPIKRRIADAKPPPHRLIHIPPALDLQSEKVVNAPDLKYTPVATTLDLKPIEEPKQPFRKPVNIPNALSDNQLQTAKTQEFVALSLPNNVVKLLIDSIEKSNFTVQQPYYEENLNKIVPATLNRGEESDKRLIEKPVEFTLDPRNTSDQQTECGKLSRLYSEGPNAPWLVALYRTLKLDSKYLCGGTLVSTYDVITAAHCITQKGTNKALDKSAMTVYLGKRNLRFSEEGVQIRLVRELIVHHQYDGFTFTRDIAIVKLREPAQFTDWVQPICLWPEDQVDIAYVRDKKGSVIGWAYNEKDELNDELSLVRMPVVDGFTCLLSKVSFFAKYTSEYTYCAGDRNVATVCNGDSGSGMVFNVKGSWHLRGIVSLSVPREDKTTLCDPRHYIVFTDVAKFSSWIKHHIEI